MIKRPEAARVLRTARHAAGLSQRALAQRTRVPQPTIAAIEAGRQDPRYETLATLIAACGREITTLPRLGIGIDRSQIRQLLRLTPDQRLRSAAHDADALDRLLRSVKR